YVISPEASMALGTIQAEAKQTISTVPPRVRLPAELLAGEERGAEFAQLHRVLSRVQRELVDLRRAEQRLRAQQAITRALAHSSSLAEAGPRIFEALCSTLDFDWGELWRVDPAANVLRCTQTWQPPSQHNARLVRAIRLAT